MTGVQEHLEHHREAFKNIARQHITKQLSLLEWEEFRALAANRRHWVGGQVQPDPDPYIRPADLVREALTEDAISVKELLAVEAFAPVVIGEIEGQGVYYLEGQGVYFWGESPTSPTLMLWLTHPAYPRGW